MDPALIPLVTGSVDLRYYLGRLDSVARVSSPLSGPDDPEHDGRLWQEPEQVAVERALDVYGPCVFLFIVRFFDGELSTGPVDGCVPECPNSPLSSRDYRGSIHAVFPRSTVLVRVVGGYFGH